MIHWSLLKKTLRDVRWLWLTCAACLFVFAWLHVLINSQFGMDRLAKIIEYIPEGIEKLAPVPFKELLTYPARLAVLYEEPLIYLLLTIWCVARSSDVVSGELGRGTMEILLSQPISRRQVLATPTIVTLVGMTSLVLVVLAGTYFGIATSSVEKPMSGWKIPFTGLDVPVEVNPSTERVPMSSFVSVRQMLPAALNYFCLGFFLCGVCTMLSCFDRYRWRTLGIMIGFYIIEMLAEVLGQAVDSFSWLRRMSFFRAYEPVMFVSKSVKHPELAWSWFERDGAGHIIDLGPLTCDTILLTLGAIAFVVAGFVFARRDLPAPI